MHLSIRTSLNIALAALCGGVMVISLAGCAHSDDAGPAAPKLGTDTLPQAPHQGDPPGVIGKDGTPTGPAAGLPLPGNKGKVKSGL